MTKIIVFGADGQLGKTFRFIASNYNYDFLFADINEVNFTDKKALEGFLINNPSDVIINCAAFTAVDKAESDQELCLSVNTIAPTIIAQYCKNNNTKLIHYSTNFVFDGKSNEEYVETDDTNPCNFYGFSKMKAEENILKINPAALIIRISGLISIYGNNFISSMKLLMNEKEELSVVKNQFTKLTSANNLAKDSLKLLQYIPNNTDVLHYANDPAASWFDFARIVKQKLNSNCKIKATNDYPQTAIRPKYAVLNCSKAEIIYHLSFKPIDKTINKILMD